MLRAHAIGLTAALVAVALGTTAVVSLAGAPQAGASASPAASNAASAATSAPVAARPSPSPSVAQGIAAAPSAGASAATTPSRTPVASRAPAAVQPAAYPPLAQLVGQRLMVAMSGTKPSASLLGRIRRGEVGGIILFGSNIASASQVRALTRSLQAAAKAGRQPPLLISTDQEGGAIKRLAWAPPTIGPPAMGRDGRTATARSQGAATGAALAKVGINVDLAPVADVPASTGSFIYQQGRTWSFSASVTSRLSNAFAAGLVGKGVAATMKHFPGLGYALRNTDLFSVRITRSRAQLSAGLDPYRAGIAAGVPIVMLSNAVYTAYDPNSAAGWSRPIGVALLRVQMGFTGVTITDGLDGAATSRGVSVSSLAVRALRANTDLILVTGSEAASAAVYNSLLAAAKSSAGGVSAANLHSSWTRIQSLKAAFPGS